MQLSSISGRYTSFLPSKSIYRRYEKPGTIVPVSSISLIETVYMQEKGSILSATLRPLEIVRRASDTVLSLAALRTVVALSVGPVIRDEIANMPDHLVHATISENKETRSCDSD